MRLGRVDLVIVGADRIAANGDVANKIGTYGVAVLAREHGIPFYVCAPLSTFDPSQIPDPKGRQVVFACRSGRRSVTASQAAQAKGFAYDSHLAGGILAWKAAGLPTES